MENQLINNRYKVIKKLGEGGMGAVMLVEDTLQDNRQVALKKVLSNSGKNSIIEILKHEFEVLTQLRHPNIASAYDYGIIQESNENYFTTQYIEGIDLFRGTKEMDMDAIIDLMVQCCRGLDYVHSRGLVHQDIKPDNILITFDSADEEADREGRLVKIIDFGLIDRENYVQGAVRGTPQFIAPEKLKGENVDRRSDLYSFGIVMFFICTRRLPFIAKSNKALILKHLYEDPPTPRKIREEVPAALEKIILKLISKEPGDRFVTAADTIRALNELMGKNFPIDTDESMESYILSGKFVGREEELQFLKDIFKVIFWKSEEQAEKEKESQSRSQAEALDAMLLGSEEEEGEEDKEVDTSQVPHLALLGGESGVGKSRIVREFKYYTQLRGVNYLEVEAMASSSSDSVLNRLLQALYPFATPRHLDNPEFRQELAKFIPQIEVSESEDEADLSPAEARVRMMERLSQFILTVAKDNPFVFFVDNLQWIDEVSLKTLSYLANLVHREAERGNHYPLMVVGCYRENEVSGSPLEPFLEDIEERNYLKAQSLMPLSEEAMEKLLTSMFGTEDIPPPFTTGLLEEAKGNPLFLEEILKSLVEGKKIWRKGGSWEFPQSLEGITVPQNVAEIMLERITSLDEKTQSLLQVVAVVGRTFTPDLLSRYFNWDIREVLDILKVLEQRQILRKEISEDDVYYSFFQTKIGETLYEKIDGEKLKGYHNKVGQVLEDYYGDDKEGHIAELAHHFLRAGEREKGLDYGFRAAEQLKKSFANEQAVAIYEEVVKLLGPEDIRRRTQTFLTMAGLYEFLGDFDRGIQKLENVLSGPRLSKLVRVQLQRKIAHLFMRKGEVDKAREIIESAISELRNPAAPEMGICLGTRGQIEVKEGHPEAAREDLEEAIDILERHNREKELIGIWNARGILELNLGHWEEAADSFNNCLQLCKELENLQGQGAALANLALTNIEASRFDLAEKYIQQAQPIFQKIGDQKASVLALYNQAEIYYQLGQFDEAEEKASEAYQISQDLGDPLLLAKTSYILGSIEKAQGDFQKAKVKLNRAVESAEESGDHRILVMSVQRLGEFQMALGFYKEAQTLLRRALEIAKKRSYHFIFAQVSRAQGVLSARRKNRKMSEKAISASLNICRDLNLKGEGAKTLLAKAQAMADLKDAGEGLKALEQARPILKKMESAKIQCEMFLIEGQLKAMYGRPQEAIESLRKAFERCRNINYRELLTDALLLLSFTYKDDNKEQMSEKFRNAARQLLTTLTKDLDPSLRKTYFTSKRARLA